MSRIKCFFVEPTGRKFWRSGSSTSWGRKDIECPVHGKFHGANSPWSEGDLKDKTAGSLGPEACDCGYLFKPSERRDGAGCTEFRRTDTGEVLPLGLADFPVGAMFYQEWLEYDTLPAYGEEASGEPMHWWRGPDNRILAVMTPGGLWSIDTRASNCGRPDDNRHRCWVRHGVPPEITVDKAGDTCPAGAGSIQIGSYHGFLRNGYLEEC